MENKFGGKMKNIIPLLEDLIESYYKTYSKWPGYISANIETIKKIEKEFEELMSYADTTIHKDNVFYYRGIPCIPNEKETFITLF